MNRSVPIATLPEKVRVEDAVESACAEDVAFIEERLRRGISVLVECDKELVLYLYLLIRGRMRKEEGSPRLVVVDGRPDPNAETNPPAMTQMLNQLGDVIRGSVDRTVVVLPHLDVLTSANATLTMEAREAIPLLYENPEAVFLGFRDPSFFLPTVIRSVFGASREIVGTPRTALTSIITQREARAIDAETFDPFGMYKFVSGLNPVRCRKLFEGLGLKREALPGRPSKAIYAEIRQQTAADDVELPNVDLERDIGGYAEVKQRLREDLIDLVSRKTDLQDPDDIQTLESLLPRGVIFHGPPGTGKTYFAKAMATALNATIFVVSGPELKSKWVGESEENLRRLFRTARKAAPSIIVFDEIDAFAHRRGSYEGAGVEHSMVNQLLTEMDGFRSNEEIFIIGTTNFLESLDGALLRPGRFEYLIEIPAPDDQDRDAIIRIYSDKLKLDLDDEHIAHLVRRSEGLADPEQGLPFTGDHLFAVCRALKRLSLRTGQKTFTRADIDKALQRRARRPIILSAQEEKVVAVHESGHALLAIVVDGASAPERISINSDQDGALGYVLRTARARPYAMTEADIRADICVGLGGLAAEDAVFGETTVGARQDLVQATQLASALVEEFGMSRLGPRASMFDRRGRRAAESENRRAAVDAEVDRILSEERDRAKRLMQQHRALLDTLTDALLEHKVLEGTRLSELMTSAETKETKDG